MAKQTDREGLTGNRLRRVWVWLAMAALGLVVAGPILWWRLGAAGPDCGGGTAVAGGSIGGPFTLVDQTGRRVTEAEVLRDPALVYFGYTWCPDVCPLDVTRNADAVDLLQEQSLEVTPVFVSVDPARDTPEVLADYAGYMHPRLVALTGTPEQVKAAADAYRVYYKAHEGEDYLVDHTTFTYLMMPGRGFVDVFGRDVPAEEMAARTACYLRT
jgi:protein SCO1